MPTRRDLFQAAVPLALTGTLVGCEAQCHYESHPKPDLERLRLCADFVNAASKTLPPPPRWWTWEDWLAVQKMRYGHGATAEFKTPANFTM